MTTIWCMVPETPRATDRIFCHFGPIFHFYSATTQKFKILKKWKNTRRYYHLTQVYHKQQSYDVWFLRYGAWQTKCLVILDSFLPFYSPFKTKNRNFQKLEKKQLEISSFYIHVPKIMIRWRMAPEICCTTDGQMDAQTEKVTYGGGCPT